MELLAIITALGFFLFFMLSPSAASQQVFAKSPYEDEHEMQLKLPALPRKMKLTEEANEKTVGVKNYAPQIKQEALSDKQHKKEANMVHAKKGTRREWFEGGTDTPQYFTMDYWHVRKRRPIHNKFVPLDVAP